MELRLTQHMLAYAAAAAFVGSSCSQYSALSERSSSAEAIQPQKLDQAHATHDAPKQTSRSPVPGACTELAFENVGRPGCYMAAEITVENPPADIYWNVYSFPSAGAAAAAAGSHKWSATTHSHGLHWAHVLSAERVRLGGGKRMAVVGPMALEAGKVVRARFIESYFPPGMRTSVHSHPGPEGFYVLDGVQCMETPLDKRQLRAGETLIVPARRTHFQAAPRGRRNVAVVFYPPDEPWMKMERGWAPTGYCDPNQASGT